MSHYKFILSTENTHVPGYVTEKALEPLEAGTVPVYYGAPDIHHFMPPESFIDGSKYTAAHLATLITALNNDPAHLATVITVLNNNPGASFESSQNASPLWSSCSSGKVLGAPGGGHSAGEAWCSMHGAADIRQFMLPESFINGSKHSAAHLAMLITVRSPTTQ
ncbi:unnamed protein product, partial [Closterium sp. NIES-54]